MMQPMESESPDSLLVDSQVTTSVSQETYFPYSRHDSVITAFEHASHRSH